MPIRTTCSSCGKNLKIRDDLIGKKVKCPACGIGFVAAAVDTVEAVRPLASKPGPSPSAKDRFATKPMSKKSPPPPEDDYDDEDDEEREERPARAKGKKKGKAGADSKRMWIWGGVGAALLVVVLVAGYLLFFNKGPTKTGPIAKGKTIPVAQPLESDALADLVPGDAIFFASVSGDAWNAPALAALRKMSEKDVNEACQENLGMSIDNVERISAFTVQSFAEQQKSDKPLVIVLKTRTPVQKEEVVKVLKKGMLGDQGRSHVEFITDRTALLCPESLWPLYQAKKGKTKATGALEKALAKANTSKGLVAGGVVPPDAVKMAASMLAFVPPSIPTLAPLLKTKAVVFSIEVSDRADVSLELFTDNAADAQEMKTTVTELNNFANKSLDDLAKAQELAPLVSLGKQILKSLKVDVGPANIAMSLSIDLNNAADVAVPNVMKMFSAGGATQEMNNLRQIGLAWQIFHDSNQFFPPQTFKKGLSWRVAILPYIEQNGLYQQFKLDEPWDSAHNKKLIPLMPKIYESPVRKAKAGETFLQTFVGPKTINSNKMKGMQMTRIPDGTSNTIIVAEAATSVPWTKPEDITVNPGQPVVLRGSDPRFFMVVFADGSVRKLSTDLNQQTLRWLIDPADGHAIPNLDAAPPGKKGL